MGKPADLVQGTLDLLIPATIFREPMNGWAVAKSIVQVSNDVSQVQQGSLYPAPHRLEHKGWIMSRWKASENNCRPKFYSSTAARCKEIKSELESAKGADARRHSAKELLPSWGEALDTGPVLRVFFQSWCRLLNAIRLRIEAS